MTLWTLEITSRLGTECLIGRAPDSHAGYAAALRAVAAANVATGFEHPRYTVTVNGAPAVIIGTGVEDTGLPDHRGVADLLNRINYDSTA